MTMEKSCKGDGTTSGGAKPAGGAKPKGKAAKLTAMGTARYIASVHIVCGHLYAEGAINQWYTSGWGFTWVPFFMMLSGFILTYVRLNSRDPSKREGRFSFLIKRLRGIYPLYLAGLLARMAQVTILNDKEFSLGTPRETVLSLTLTQAWDPNFVDKAVQTHCWFLSCILPYWFFHQDAYAVVRKAWTSVLVLFAVLVCLVPLLGFWFVPDLFDDVQSNWYSFESGQPFKYLDKNPSFTTLTLRNFLKFHPIFYFHIYLSGMVAAVLMHRREQFWVPVQWLFQYGAIIGLTGLFGAFLLEPIFVAPGYKLSCRLGALAPLQGLYLIGLSLHKDPVARLFGLPIFAPLENLSYAQYVFQFIAFTGWPRNGNSVTFWISLQCLAMLGYAWVQKPLKSATIPKKKQALGIFCMIIVLPGIVALQSELLKLARQSDREQDTPAQARRRLATPDDFSLSELLQEEVRLAGGLNESGTYLINPALFYDEQADAMFVAVREHRVFTSESSLEGQMSHDSDTVWKSRVFMGKIDPVTFEPLPNTFWEPLKDSDNTQWDSCTTHTRWHDAENRKFSRIMASGFEDPRFVHETEDKNRLLLTTNIFSPVHKSDKEVCDIGRRMILSKVTRNEPHLHTAETHHQNVLLNSPMGHLAALDRQIHEKNWLGFIDEQKQLLMINSIIPLQVLRPIDWEDTVHGENQTKAQVNGFVRTEKLPFEMPVEMESFISNVMKDQGVKVHGGCNPIPYNRKEDGKKVMIGCFHLLYPSGEYANYLFEFAKKPSLGVYEMERISKRLDLEEAPLQPDSGALVPLSFASAITKLPKSMGLAIGYGSSNVDARVKKMSWADVEAAFEY